MLKDLLVQLSDSQFHSGEALGESLGITRAAVWKQLKKLEAMGVVIHSVKGKGYRVPEPLELLTREALLASGWVAAIDPIILFEVDSTNDEAKRRLVQGACAPILVLAERQTQGRGRRGRQWQGGIGQNIMLSFAWCFESGVAVTEGLSLAVGVAVARVLKQLGVQNIGLKWPNDVQIEGKKAAGVLLEMVADGDACHVIIGVGVNVSMPESVMTAVDQPWTDIASQLKMPVQRNAMVAQLGQELMSICQSFESGDGLRRYLDEWRAYDVLANSPVQLLLASKVEDGVARGVDNKGALLLETVDGVRSIFGGEVSVRRQ